MSLQGEGNQPNQPDPQKTGHFSGLTRVAGGALSGLVCNYFSGGSVMGAVKGAVTLCNSIGGGPLAAAGVGAALSLIF
ncbi:hypothetical protein IV102_30625 [bacterium]|nr:hypothetical protein [bacterium]